VGKELNEALIIQNAYNIIKKGKFKKIEGYAYAYKQFGNIFIFLNLIVGTYMIEEAKDFEEAWENLKNKRGLK
jgi:hypothetical protein